MSVCDTPETLKPVLAWTGERWVRAIHVIERCRPHLVPDPQVLWWFDEQTEAVYWHPGWYEVFGDPKDAHFNVEPLCCVLTWQHLPAVPVPENGSATA